jgi:SAM-dependent methyltransferase
VSNFFGPSFAAIYERYFFGNVVAATRIIYEFHQREFSGSDPRLLDLCCGTGYLAGYFAERGYTVVGVDLSAAMLEKAAERLADPISTGRVRLIQSDATDFASPGPVHLVTCTSDSLNHLPDIAALQKCFSAVRKSMVPGGLFVFDVHSVAGVREHNFSIARESEDIVIIIKATYDSASTRMIARVVGCRRLDGSRTWERFEQEAWVSAWPADEVLTALSDSGFTDAWPATLDSLATPISDADAIPRIYFVARA